MKILIAGEASVHLLNYCRAIRPFVDEMVFVCETPFQIPEAKNTHIVNFRGTDLIRWFFEFRKLKKIIASEKPDLVHIHQVNRLAFFVCKTLEFKKIPIVVTAWGSDVLLVPERNFIFKKLTTFVLKKSARVTADAGIMIEAMQNLAPSVSRYVLLQYGIDPVTPLPKEKIIYSNRLHEKLYNIDLIIKDFAFFAERNPGWQLHIGGSGKETDRLKELASTLKVADRINFLGWLDKKANSENYGKAAIYVSVPSSDGTSVSLLEAMSANCIPVVSDLPVNRDWIEQGINGIIRQEDRNPFEQAIQMDKEKCVAINQQKINRSALRENTIKEFFGIYKKVLQDN